MARSDRPLLSSKAKNGNRFSPFRTFLLTRYLKDLSVQKTALKRGGKNAILSLDFMEAEERLGDAATQRLRLTFRKGGQELIAGTLVDPSQDAIKEEMEQLQRALL
ncbi:MAG: hypothetical protein OSB05_11980 [Akkermansiaceae bacterium]|nr:hypothetical protein [Akkermansiaceae bacterium]